MTYYTVDTFDWKFYIGNYIDLRKAGILSQKKAWKHWKLYGCKENRIHRKIKVEPVHTEISRAEAEAKAQAEARARVLAHKAKVAAAERAKSEAKARAKARARAAVEAEARMKFLAEARVKAAVERAWSYAALEISIPTSQINGNFEIKIKKFNEKTLFYLNQEWQYPVITEKRVFDLYYSQNSIPHNYFAFPWATLIDQMNSLGRINLLNIIYNYKIDKIECFTVCQHINFRKLLPIFKKIGITHLSASHTTHNDYLLEEKYNIKIIPFPLFPFNYNSKQQSGKNDKYLFSFCGAYDKRYYLTDIRRRLTIFKDKIDCYIKIKNKWHFEDIVYGNQIKKKNILIDTKEKEVEFSELLLNSTFSLCPGGSGPNSIRLWESLSYGCIPVILSNEHKLPDFIHWGDFCILYNDENISNLYEYLISIPKEKINLMKEKCKEVFNSYFSKENFNKTIDIYFENAFIKIDNKIRIEFTPIKF